MLDDVVVEDGIYDEDTCGVVVDHEDHEEVGHEVVVHEVEDHEDEIRRVGSNEVVVGIYDFQGYFYNLLIPF